MPRDVLRAFLADCEFRQLSPETVRKYRTHCTRFVRELRAVEGEGTWPPAPAEIQAFISGLQVSRRARINYWTSIKTFLGFGRTWFGHDDPTHVMRAPQRPRQTIAVLSHDQAAAMWAAARTMRERILLLLILGAGLRRGEVVQVRPEDVGTVYTNIPGGKTGQRFVATPPGLAELVATLGIPSKGAPEWLFPSHIPGRHARGDWAGRMFALIAARAGIPAGPLRRAHAGRHYYATAAAEGGVPVFALQRQLGHASAKSTEIYTHHGLSAFVDQLQTASPAGRFGPVKPTQLTLDLAMLPARPAATPIAEIVELDEYAPRRRRIRTRLIRYVGPDGVELEGHVLPHGYKSQRALADAIGVSWGTLSGIRRGYWGIGQRFIDGALRAFAGRFTYAEMFFEEIVDEDAAA